MLLNWEVCVLCGLSGSDAEPVFPWRPAEVAGRAIIFWTG